LIRRKNRTIIEATKAMMHDQSLPMIMWAEACMATIYVQNKSPHQILKNITPEEAFTGVKPEKRHSIFSSIFPCTQREEIQDRPFREKGYICGIQ
jgi:hypothetical protein